MATKRLFFALLPGDSARAACQRAAAQLAMQLLPSGYRLVPPERYHLTLAFIGNAIGAEQEAALRKAAARVAERSFRITLDTAGSFRRANVWWLGMRAVPEVLERFHHGLHERLAEFGVHLDHSRFIPHVTVIKALQALPPTLIEPIEWTVSDFVLMQSQLGPAGPHYEVLQRWGLDGSADPER